MKSIILVLSLVSCMMTGFQRNEEIVVGTRNITVESSMNSEYKEETYLEKETIKEIVEEVKEEESVQATEENKEFHSTASIGVYVKVVNNDKTEVLNKNGIETKDTIVSVPLPSYNEVELNEMYSDIINTGYEFIINGESYAMPFQYKEMVNKNWTEPDSNLKNDTVNSDIRIDNDGKTIGISLQNITDSYLFYNNCLVTEIEVDKSDVQSGTSIVLPKNITMNSTKYDVIKAYGEAGYCAEDNKYEMFLTDENGIMILFDESGENIESIRIVNYIR